MTASTALPLATDRLHLPLLAPRPVFRAQPAEAPPERRQARRQDRAVEFEEHDLDGGAYARVAADLSVGGLSAREGFARTTGARLWLRVFLPDSLPLELRAEVVGPYADGAGLRVRFVDLEPGNLAALEDYLLGAPDET